MEDTGTGTGTNLYQRIAKVQAAVSVKVTGVNERGGKAISIKDTEKALRDLLAELGIVTLWSQTSLTAYSQTTSKGQMTMWQVAADVTLVNVDDPNDKEVHKWGDVGTNPSAAASFMRKGFYKALFHIADADDDKITQADFVSRVPAARTAPQRPPQPSDPDTDLTGWALGNECPMPDCGGRVGGSRTNPKCSRGHLPTGEMVPEADGS